MEPTVFRFPGASKRTDKVPDVDLNGFRIDAAWGLSPTPVEQDARFARGSTLEPILEKTGEWWLVAKDQRGRYMILADPFGMQPMYTSVATTIDGSSLFVGGSAAETARSIRTAGASIDNNWSSLLSRLTSRHPFLECVYDYSTSTENISMVAADQAVLIENGTFSLIPRPVSNALATGDYDALVTLGVERAMEELWNLVQDYAHVNFKLSGGKDSRAVLALALQAGVAKNLSIEASDPAPAGGTLANQTTVREDLAISSRMVKKFGLHWLDQRTPRDTWPDTLWGQLAVFQKLRHGLNTKFYPAGLTYRLHEPEARINGAGGGIYRAHWSSAFSTTHIWGRLGLSSGSQREDAAILFNGLSSDLPLPPDLRRQAETSFADALSYLSQGTIADALNLHLSHFRIRGHASALKWGRSFGMTNLPILLRPEFVHAISKLPTQERFSGRILYDIVEKVAPELHDLEYQSGAWAFDKHRPTVFDWSTIPSDEESFWQSKERIKASARPSGYRGRPRPDMTSAINSGITELVDSMRQDGIDSSVIETVRQNPPTDMRAQGRLLSQLADWAGGFVDGGSLAPAVEPMPPRVRTF